MRYFIINTKNYSEVAGEFIVDLADQLRKISSDFPRISMQVAVPAFSLLSLRKSFPEIRLLAQHLDNAQPGSSTGFLVPELAKSYGANGSILNHSEHRISEKDVGVLVERLKTIGMESLVCAQNSDEALNLGQLGPTYIAIEPPELIGSGRAVSKSRPELISETKSKLDRLEPGRKPIFLCGAGIVSQDDVRRAVELGAQGVLVASGVIRSKDWSETISSLAQGLNGE